MFYFNFSKLESNCERKEHRKAGGSANKIRFKKLVQNKAKSGPTISGGGSISSSSSSSINNQKLSSEESCVNDNSFENIYIENKNLLLKTINTKQQPPNQSSKVFVQVVEDSDELTDTIIEANSKGKKKTMLESSEQAAPSQNEPRKDHYSYSYSYKTADPESGIPGLNSVEVNESVTEEIGPDGSKIIRRHQQEKQINKITQVVTQRVIKRQYIDPSTGQIIEYDPNNELFANLPPETVFEEHTIVSDDNAGSLPVITTTTTSKTTPIMTATQQPQHNAVSHLSANFNNIKINEQDYVDNYNKYSSLLKQQHQHNLLLTQPTATASFRIKSHPEDNQGYPEERNMDYDPDDINCYPDDDLPYEGD